VLEGCAQQSKTQRSLSIEAGWYVHWHGTGPFQLKGSNNSNLCLQSWPVHARAHWHVQGWYSQAAYIALCRLLHPTYRHESLHNGSALVDSINQVLVQLVLLQTLAGLWCEGKKQVVGKLHRKQDRMGLTASPRKTCMLSGMASKQTAWNLL